MITTAILPIKLHSIKFISRWYLTVKITTFKQSKNTLNWKGCKEAANHIHCWWTCKIIQNFWSNICKIITEITNHAVNEKPEFVLLNS